LGFEAIYLHPELFSGQGANAFRPLRQSLYDNGITDLSTFVLSLFVIELLPQDLDDQVLVQYFLIELLDQLTALVLFGQVLDCCLFLLEDLDGVEERLDLIGVDFIQDFIVIDVLLILPSACSSIFRYSSIYFCLSERADSRVATLNFSWFISWASLIEIIQI
jgi:hypothetical protein